MSSSEDPQGSNGRSEYTETIEIPSDKVGKIIGKGGSNIREIQTMFAVTAKVDKTSYSGSTNAVRVSGNRDDVERAMEHISQQAKEDNILSRGGPQGNNTGSEYTETIEIPSDKVGKIIGKGGSNIREIQTTFGVTAKVDKSSYSGSTNAVRVSGNRDDVERAMECIKQQADEQMQPRMGERYGGNSGGNYNNHY